MGRLADISARGLTFAVRVKTDTIARQLGDGTKERRLFGAIITLDLARSPGHRALYVEGERFVTERHLVQSLVKPGQPVVDVGANIGYYMLLLKQAGGSPVVCFEPEPDNFRELERTTARNGFTDVELIPCAVGAEPGTVRLNPGPNAVVGTGSHEVRQVTLDSHVSAAGLLKVDVEGYERQVLDGAGALLASRPNLFIELHPDGVPALADIEWVVGFARDRYRSVRLVRQRVPSDRLGRVVARYRPRLEPVSGWQRSDPPFWLLAR